MTKQYRWVKYLGSQIRVHKSIKFIATDSSGEVYGYTHRPEIRGYAWMLPYAARDTGGTVYLQDKDLGIPWDLSLIEVDAL